MQKINTMGRGNEGASGKGSGRQGGRDSGGSKGGNRRNAGSTDHRGKSSSRGNAPTGKPTTRGGKNQVVGTSRSGNPVTKKEYIMRKKSEGSKSKPDDGTIRLNKFISNSGICSRRDADIYIQAGSVTVNGKPVSEMGYRVKLTDEVKFDGQNIQPYKKQYLLLNKPKGFIAPRKGERASKTVLDLMQSAGVANLHYVGRLGRQSVGLMLFTNDLEMANKLNNPNLEMRKIYQVALDRSFKHEDLMQLRNGMAINGEIIDVKEINYVEDGRNNEVGIEIHSGKDNIVQALFETVKYEIKVLDRVVLGGLTKKDLPRGHYRTLTEQEIINLKMI
ncbi:ribosomal large subunit pseudouridine synthase B [Nonlabens ulvanivorans]|nr:ribosomal large subunit pseudouridine synthase B [Nonlabens ulvanivorans]